MSHAWFLMGAAHPDVDSGSRRDQSIRECKRFGATECEEPAVITLIDDYQVG